MPATLITLGSCSVVHEATRVAIRPGIAAMLAYITLECPHGVERAEIASKLWPDSPLGRARRSLSQLVYEATNELPRVLNSSNTRTLVASDLHTDVQHLHALVKDEQYLEALALYGGSFMQAAALRGDLEHWADRIEARVVKDLAKAASNLIVSASTSVIADAIPLLENILRRHPTNSDLTTSLISSFLQLDRQNEAREAYEYFVSEVGQGIIPSFESFSDQAKAVDLGDSSTVPFVGRATQLNELAESWAAAQAGNGGTVLLYGEPGIGKSRLATQALRRVAVSGGRVWTVKCNAATQRIPYSVVAELLRQNGESADDPHSSFLQGGDITANKGESVKEWKYQVVQYLTELILERAKSRSLAVLIDDVQWADEFTALLIKYWSYRLRGSPVMLLLTLGTNDGAPTDEWNAGELVGARLIQVGQLGITDAAAMLSSYERTRRTIFSHKQRDSVLWQSAGRPYLLLEALAAIDRTDPDAGPESVVLPESAETMLRHRFVGLSEEATWLLGLLAVMGQAVPVIQINSISGLDARDVAIAMEQLHKRGVIQFSDGAISFVHALMKEAAKRSISSSALSLMHGRVADTLLQSDGDKGLIAQHYAEAGDKTKASHLALDAGLAALSRLLYADAEYYLRLSIQTGAPPVSSKAAFELARLYMQSGRSNSAEALLQFLPPQGESKESDLIRVLIRIECDMSTSSTTVENLVDRASSLLSHVELIASADLTRVLGTLFDLAVDSGQPEFGAMLLQSVASSVSRKTADEAQLQISAKTAVWVGLTSSYRSGLEKLQQARDLFDEQSSEATVSVCVGAEAKLNLLAGSLTIAEEQFTKVLKHAMSAGDTRREIAVRLNTGVVQLERRKIDKARANFEMGISAPSVQYRLRAYSNLAVLHYEIAQYTLARQAADAVLNANRTYSAPSFDRVAHSIHGLVRIQAGDIPGAQVHADRVPLEAVWLSSLDDVSYSVALHAKIAVVTGSPQHALDLIERATAITEPKHKMCTLRLRVLKASILARTEPDVAYATAKRVLYEAQQLDARMVATQAEEVIAHCDLFR